MGCPTDRLVMCIDMYATSITHPSLLPLLLYTMSRGLSRKHIRSEEEYYALCAADSSKHRKAEQSSSWPGFTAESLTVGTLLDWERHTLHWVTARVVSHEPASSDGTPVTIRIEALSMQCSCSRTSGPIHLSPMPHWLAPSGQYSGSSRALKQEMFERATTLPCREEAVRRRMAWPPGQYVWYADRSSSEQPYRWTDACVLEHSNANEVVIRTADISGIVVPLISCRLRDPPADTPNPFVSTEPVASVPIRAKQVLTYKRGRDDYVCNWEKQDDEAPWNCRTFCMRTLRDPVTHHPCGTMFCRSCVEAYRKSKSLSAARCPICVTIPWEDSSGRLTSAPLEVKRCLEERVVTCTHCGKDVKFNTLPRHWMDECPVACRHEGCGSAAAHLGLSKLWEHENRECKVGRVSCPDPFGKCQWTGLACELGKHVKTCEPLKLMRLEEAFQKHKRDILHMKHQLAQIEKHKRREYNLTFLHVGALVDVRVVSDGRWRLMRVKETRTHTVVVQYGSDVPFPHSFEFPLDSNALDKAGTHTYGLYAVQEAFYAGHTFLKECACGGAPDCLGARVTSKILTSSPAIVVQNSSINSNDRINGSNSISIAHLH